MPRAGLHITLFVYGTLKRGQWNHGRFCGRATDIRPANIVGHLYEFPAGFPAVVVPETSILAYGTGDPVADARTQIEATARGVEVPEIEGNWDTVHGEVITLPDPARDLPPLDRLEGFRPGGPALYGRVLVAARVAACPQPVWVYRMARVGEAQRLRGGRWQPPLPDC
jgi:gamma-glutamylcyclotransferase (GGCT)/AIG2-like uncharacterized protein YtfP